MICEISEIHDREQDNYADNAQQECGEARMAPETKACESLREMDALQLSMKDLLQSKRAATNG